MLVLLFLAVTSAASAELVAVSSLMTYDVYIPYVNPRATDKAILWVDHLAIIAYGIFMGVLGVIFFYAGISMGWLYEFMGVLLGSAVLPIALAIMSKSANKWCCIAGAWAGVVCGVIAWLVATSTLNNGVISVETTFGNYPMLAGNLGSILVGALISGGGSMIWPEDFDFSITRALNTDHRNASTPPTAFESDTQSVDAEKQEKAHDSPTHATEVKATARSPVRTQDEYGLEYQRKLQRAFKIAVIVSIVLFVILILLIPLPLFGSEYIFPSAGFTGWISICFVWLFWGCGAVVLYPLYESRQGLKEVSGAVIRDIFGGRLRKLATSDVA